MPMAWGKMGRAQEMLGVPFLELICPGLATLLL